MCCIDFICSIYVSIIGSEVQESKDLIDNSLPVAFRCIVELYELLWRWGHRKKSRSVEEEFAGGQCQGLEH